MNHPIAPQELGNLQSLTRVAPAKINLALAVAPAEETGKHAGWHRIRSWFHAIDLGDTVTLTVRPEGSPSVLTRFDGDAPQPGAIDWNPGCDLTLRALHALGAHVGRELPVHADVVKRIPTGGGLGGGSSNAAAALRGARDLFDLPVPDQTLRKIGMTLGSDVPFFLDSSLAAPRPALVGGFGDSIERIERATGSLVLALPPVACSTPAVYKAFDSLPQRPFNAEGVDALAAVGRPASVATRLFNDLAVPAEIVTPALAGLRDALTDSLDLPVHVTGSGSACFALLDTEHGSAHGSPTASFVAAQAAAEAALPGTKLVRANLI